jgi:NADH-quinone oxidoreductase subunit C
MTDETKQPADPAPGDTSGKPAGSSENSQSAEPKPPGSSADVPSGAPGAPAKPSEKPVAPTPPVGEPAPVAAKPTATPQAPAAGAPGKPAAPAKPATPPAPRPVVKPEPWSSPLLEELNKRFPASITDPLVFRNQPYLTVSKESLIGVCEFLKSDEGGAYTYLVDETALDYPNRGKRFEVIYVLYSFKRNDRLRLKVLIGEKENLPSVAAVWPTANWLEREVFDMFGVQYEGHPDLRRILLPEEWVGHPLRKDYDILKQDDAWVQANLGIETGQ